MAADFWKHPHPDRSLFVTRRSEAGGGWEVGWFLEITKVMPRAKLKWKKKHENARCTWKYELKNGR